MGPVALRHVGSSQTRARTRVPCIGRQILNHCDTREAPYTVLLMNVFWNDKLMVSISKRMNKIMLWKKTFLLYLIFICIFSFLEALWVFWFKAQGGCNLLTIALWVLDYSKLFLKFLRNLVFGKETSSLKDTTTEYENLDSIANHEKRKISSGCLNNFSYLAFIPSDYVFLEQTF